MFSAQYFGNWIHFSKKSVTTWKIVRKRMKAIKRLFMNMSVFWVFEDYQWNPPIFRQFQVKYKFMNQYLVRRCNWFRWFKSTSSPFMHLRLLLSKKTDLNTYADVGNTDCDWIEYNVEKCQESGNPKWEDDQYNQPNYEPQSFRHFRTCKKIFSNQEKK